MNNNLLLWNISWSAMLTPELQMIPDRSVFLRAPEGRSLTATIEGIPSLLPEVPLCSFIENQHIITSIVELVRI